MLFPRVTVVSTRGHTVKFYWCCQAGVRSALFIPTDPRPPPKSLLITISSSQTRAFIIRLTPSLLSLSCYSCARPQEIITRLLCPHSTHILSTRPGSKPFVMKSSPCPRVTRSLCLCPPPLPPLYWIREKLWARAIWHCHAIDRNCRQQKQKHGL